MPYKEKIKTVAANFPGVLDSNRLNFTTMKMKINSSKVCMR